MTELDISNIPSLYRFTKHYHSTSDVSSGFGTRRAKNNFFATKLATGNVPPLMLLSFRLTGEIWVIVICISHSHEISRQTRGSGKRINFSSFLTSLEMTGLAFSNIPSHYRLTKHYHLTSDGSVRLWNPSREKLLVCNKVGDGKCHLLHAAVISTKGRNLIKVPLLRFRITFL